MNFFKSSREQTVSDDFKPGLEGVIAFESEIAEPDKEGSALRYRGVDIEDLVGRVSFGNVWGLLVDDVFNPGLPNAEPFPLPVHSGDVRVDVQSAIAMLAPAWGFKPLLDIDDAEARSNLARTSVMVLSYLAQAARGIIASPVPESEIDKAHTVVERMMIRWRGEPDPAHVRAIDAYFVSAAEHGMNASTFTSRVIASTGADAAAALSGAIGAMSGPLHGGAPSRVLHMIEEVEKSGNAEEYVKGLLDRKERLMGFCHRVYLAEIHVLAHFAALQKSSMHLVMKLQKHLKKLRLKSCVNVNQIAYSKRMLSSGRQSFWISQKFQHHYLHLCLLQLVQHVGLHIFSSRSALVA